MNIKRFKNFISENQRDGVVFTFGRFNPPTTGHLKLLDKLKEEAKRLRFDYQVFVSQSYDKKKNPLDYSTKIKFMRKLFPSHGRNIIENKNIRNALEVCSYLYSKGYKKIVMVVGSDRIEEFKKLIERYNGQDERHGFYDFESIDIISAGDRDPDADDVSGMSASKLRQAAADNNFELFSRGITSKRHALDLFNELRKAMGLSEQNLKNIREKYIKGKLFSVGDKVNIISENKKGVISHLGSNYVIIEEDKTKTRTRHWLYNIKK